MPTETLADEIARRRGKARWWQSTVEQTIRFVAEHEGSRCLLIAANSVAVEMVFQQVDKVLSGGDHRVSRAKQDVRFPNGSQILIFDARRFDPDQILGLWWNRIDVESPEALTAEAREA